MADQVRPTTQTPELKATGEHGTDEYRFYEFPNGNPPGQIKAFVIHSRTSFERRVPFDKLPTASLQRTFLEVAGKTLEEIGVTILK